MASRIPTVRRTGRRKGYMHHSPKKTVARWVISMADRAVGERNILLGRSRVPKGVALRASRTSDIWGSCFSDIPAVKVLAADQMQKNAYRITNTSGGRLGVGGRAP